MEYEHIDSGSSHVTVKLETGEEVYFEAVERTDPIEYSEAWFMDGYVGDQLKYPAIGYFLVGSDEFENLEDIEVHPEYKEPVLQD